MLKNEKSAKRNDHQNRKTEVFCNKNRKTDLKNSQNRKTENPNAPLRTLPDPALFGYYFQKMILAKSNAKKINIYTSQI